MVCLSVVPDKLQGTRRFVKSFDLFVSGPGRQPASSKFLDRDPGKAAGLASRRRSSRPLLSDGGG